MKKQYISPQAFVERARPLLGPLYNAALLITDNSGAAETALQQGLLEVYLRSDAHDRRAMREQLMRAVRQKAFERLQEQPLSQYERGEWHGVSGSAVVEDKILSALLSRFSMEERELQRYLLLRYGCGVAHARAAEAANMNPIQARDSYAHFRARAAGARADAFERSLARMCRMLLAENAAAPDMSAVCRAFERDAVMAVKGKRTKRNFGAYILCAIAIFVCMFLFWLMAILLEPGAPEETARALFTYL